MLDVRVGLVLILAALWATGCGTAPDPADDDDDSAAGDDVEATTYFIITTDDVVEGSAQLVPFIAAKEQQGFVVQVATEQDWGPGDPAGLERALAIRSWLADQLTTADDAGPADVFALLIGSADPDHGDIPMVNVWPRHELPEDDCYGFQLDCRSHLTDFLYADLSGNWDLDGDGRHGERGEDDGDGGIDFDAELIVGRIPMFGGVADVDRILGHNLAYQAQSAGEAAYRRSFLLPAAWYYMAIDNTMPYGSDLDGADIAEWIVANLVQTHDDVTATTLYESDGLYPSFQAPDLPLTVDNVVEAWNDGHGMVSLYGHGDVQGVYRMVWDQDTNQNGEGDFGEVIWQPLMTSTATEGLTGERPAFVVGNDCLIGLVTEEASLAYQLLWSGGAIGVIGSTGITPGDNTDFTDPANELDLFTSGTSNLGILFFDNLLEGDAAGIAYDTARDTAGSFATVENYTGKTMLNYYGDPSLTLDR